MIDTKILTSIGLPFLRAMIALGKERFESNEEGVDFLKRFGLEKPVDRFDVLYVHAMVHCRQSKMPPPMLEIFREESVRESFRETWASGMLVPFESAVRKSVDALKVGDEIKAKGIDVERWVREVYEKFTKIVSEVRSPTEQETARKLDEIHGALVPPLDPTKSVKTLQDYLVGVIADTDRIDIKGISSRLGAGRQAMSFPIEEHYTPLKTLHRSVRYTQGSVAVLSREEGAGKLDSLTDLLADNRRLLLVGEPGGGKTTFLRFIANVLAKDILSAGDSNHTALRGKHLGLTEQESAPVPILLRLAAIAGIVKKDDSFYAGSGASWRCVDRALEPIFGEAERALLIKLLDEGKCVLLLDGLDEVVGESLRARIVEIVNGILARWAETLVVITSRPFGYQEVADLKEIITVHIDAFGEEEIGQFLSRWTAALYPEEEISNRDQYLDEIRVAIMKAPNIRRMAANPVMLTCLCVVHWNERRLPEGKADLLAAVLRWLINAREEKREERGYTNTFADEGYKALALAMTAHPEGKQVIVDLAWAADALEVPFRDELGVKGDRIRKEGVRYLEAETLDSGILEQAGMGQIRFWHLTFQEHYAARNLAGMGDAVWWRVIEPHLTDRQWWEVLDHLAGCLVWIGRGPVHYLVERILATARHGDLASIARAVGVLGRLLRILNVYEYQPPSRIGWEKVRDQAMSIFTLEGSRLVSAEERIAAAESLGQAGDPRFVSLQPEMLLIPGMLKVLLGKYPVTVHEYQAFVEGGGYRESQLWGEWWKVKSKERWEIPRDWDEQLEHLNRPVTGISWYEAMAYCNWLAENTELPYRLPSSAEWEAAASNPRGLYPWGAEEPSIEFADFGGNVGHPTPVGIYPSGAALGGHLDMAGNVWEWCSDWYRKGSDRVLRGGSWGNDAGSCRSAIRRSDPPGHRDNDLGFRLSRSAG